MTTLPSNGKTSIVVGTDGSLSADAALRWAAREARVHNAPLEVIHAWEGVVGQVVPPDAEFERHAKAVLDAAVDRLPARERPPGTNTRLVKGHAAAALIKASEGAAMVVVGSHGHGGFVGTLLGSVSQRVATHAHCPVVIVRTAD
ncbi:universal stress protein [Streptomyces sp. FXJ1.4098]|uniref:universal stress protein n=1 Tax=Streptomyces sp. NPDC020845 TaxID=3365096 RepID=UPI0029998648|nr:universal stress protein [Streptomyces sp. FXJ1.4098]